MQAAVVVLDMLKAQSQHLTVHLEEQAVADRVPD
jgi:hypothetical protein